MNAEELRGVLEEAGLSPYQADAYVTLLDLGSASATEVADASEVPDPRIYDVLRALEAEGFVETYQEGSLHARASDPEVVVSDLVGRARRLEAATEEIESRWSEPPKEAPRVGIVGRFDTLFERARSAIGEARYRVQLSVSPEEFHTLREDLVAAVDRGVDVRLSIHTRSPEGTALPSTEELAGACTEARHRPLPTPFVVLVDRSRSFFDPHPDSTNQYGVLVDDRTHAYVFHWFFATCLWEVWEPIHSSRPTEPPVAYVDVRECLRAIEPAVEDGREVSVSVSGFETATGEACELSGRVVDVEYSATTGGSEEPSIARYAGRATLVVDTGNERVAVGGWGATIEDVEATRVVVEGVE
ncbi:TrmB family transcriptional regulator [Natronorarus salvus]|uniref:TrmB family transcriptional regulator n=1 Tax=Natronorarus salvus TaxID=3117733 RepID=UPI002F263F80